MNPPRMLGDLPAGKKFKLLRTGEVFTRIGIKKLIGGPHRRGWVIVEREDGTWGQLYSRCHIREISK